MKVALNRFTLSFSNVWCLEVADVTNAVVYLSVMFLLVAILTPIAMNEIVAANTTGWQSSVVTIFNVLLPILFIIGMALYFVP